MRLLKEILFCALLWADKRIVWGMISSMPNRPSNPFVGCRANQAGPLNSCLCADQKNERNETVDERRMRFFWQDQPFQVAQDLVRRCLLNDTISMDHDIVSFSGQPQLQNSHLSHNVAYSNAGRPSFCLCLAYDGSQFCGWQRQSPQPSASTAPSTEPKPSVQEVVEDAASRYFGLPSADVRVSGRTDAGVHAIAQVARLRLHAGVTAADVQMALDDAAKMNSNPITWRCLSVQTVSHKFHPSFDTKKRSYVYLIDANDALKDLCCHSDNAVGFGDQRPDREQRLSEVVQRLDQSLKSLVGQELDYLSFSYGKVKTENTICYLHHAGARLVASRAAVAIELTGNRFLRRMVRILVATALHHAILASTVGNDFVNCTETGSTHVTLVDLCRYRERQRTSKAAPPGGLIFVGAIL